MAATAIANDSAAQAIFDSINTKGDKQTAKMSDTQNRFLTLLTAQLKNQDPLNPLDNAQVTSQMAQISTVDGIERLNATLKALVDADAGNQSLQAATMIGRKVLVPGSALTLVKGTGLGGFELSGPADGVTATIKDANGLVIRTLNLGSFDTGVHGYAWDGKAEGGTAAADGNYTVSFAAKQGGKDVEISSLALGMVAGVSRNGTDMRFDVPGLGRYSMAEIKEIL